MKRPGYYVEGRHFGDHLHQARARAAHLSAQYGRPVKVMHLAHDAKYPVEVSEIHNKTEQAA